MDDYELSARPFFINQDTHTKLFHGRSKTRNQPVVAKCHDIQYKEKAEFVKEFNLVMNAGMAQARVEHPNICKIREFCLDVNLEQGQFSVYHILEELKKDLGEEITERKAAHRAPSEAETKNFLTQTAQALAYAHSKGIAHQNIKPGSIFIDQEGTFKVGDFGTFFERKASMPATTVAGAHTYMGPQLRKFIADDTKGYDAFKSDVYSLALTTLSLASVTLLETPWLSEDRKPAALVQELGYSVALNDLLLAMLEEREEARPAMQDICFALLDSEIRSFAPTASVPPPTEEAKSASAAIFPLKGARAAQPEEGSAAELVQITNAFLCFFDFRTSIWGPQVSLSTAIQVHMWSRWVMLEGRVFCCGGCSAATYMLSRDGGVEKKADMSEMRNCHGLQTAHDAAYVFGGFVSFTCEKWELTTNQWRELPSMREMRNGFNPCLWEGRMYLCGSESMEVFVPQTDTFLPLLIPLPEMGPCCVYVHENMLVVHSNTYILKFAVEPDGQLAQRSQASSRKISKAQNSQPVVDKTKGVVYMIRDEECVCFRMEDGVSGSAVG